MSTARATGRVSLRQIPADVWAVLGLLVLAHAAVQLTPGNPVRVFVVFAVLLFVPGYALTTLAFPARRRSSDDGVATLPVSRELSDDRKAPTGPAGLTTVQRAALSFGLSVAFFPLYGLLLQVLVENFATDALLGLVSVLVPLLLGVGLLRRRRTPEAQRYQFPVRTLVSDVRHRVVAESHRDTTLNVALVVAVLISTGTLGFALVAPQDGSQFTEVSLTVRQPSGEFAGANYPTTFTEGESAPLRLQVQNKEQTTVTYTVVIQQQQLATDGSVRETAELDRFSETLVDDQDWFVEHDLTPTMVGDDQRIVYLVYRDGVPATPTLDNAYRSLTLWVDVESAEA